MTATADLSRESAATELLRALTGLKGWFREIQQGVYDGHSAASLMMLALLERNGPSRVTDLAEVARVDASVVSRQAAQLEAAGLVERSADPSDGRAHRLGVAPAGEEVLRRGRERLVRLLAERLEAWPPEELVEYAATTARLLTDLNVPTNRNRNH
ncbi:MAG TPA: MarR family transcriptional regulator [Nocardioidaceae bacterium]|nr:MarR family transcriptional regulator [Nocardioidaceae bacterium]